MIGSRSPWRHGRARRACARCRRIGKPASVAPRWRSRPSSTPPTWRASSRSRRPPQAAARGPGELSQGRRAAARGTRREEGHARGAASTAPAGGSKAVAPGGSHRTKEDRAPGSPARGAGRASRAREGPAPRFGPACGSATRTSSTSGGGEERACQGGPDAEAPAAAARRQASRRAAPTRSASDGPERANDSPTRVGALGGRVGLLGDRHRHRSRRWLGSVADGFSSRAGTAAGHSRRARSAEADRDADADPASHADSASVVLSRVTATCRGHMRPGTCPRSGSRAIGARRPSEDSSPSARAVGETGVHGPAR